MVSDAKRFTPKQAKRFTPKQTARAWNYPPFYYLKNLASMLMLTMSGAFMLEPLQGVYEPLAFGGRVSNGYYAIGALVMAVWLFVCHPHTLLGRLGYLATATFCLGISIVYLQGDIYMGAAMFLVLSVYLGRAFVSS